MANDHICPPYVYFPTGDQSRHSEARPYFNLETILGEAAQPQQGRDSDVTVAPLIGEVGGVTV